MKRSTTKANHCDYCGRIIRAHNKSGRCTTCTIKHFNYKAKLKKLKEKNETK